MKKRKAPLQMPSMPLLVAKLHIGSTIVLLDRLVHHDIFEAAAKERGISFGPTREAHLLQFTPVDRMRIIPSARFERALSAKDEEIPNALRICTKEDVAYLVTIDDKHFFWLPTTSFFCVTCFVCRQDFFMKSDDVAVFNFKTQHVLHHFVILYQFDIVCLDCPKCALYPYLSSILTTIPTALFRLIVDYCVVMETTV